MTWIKKFLADHSITTHSIAVAFAFLFAAYFQVPAFHDYVFHLYGLFPQSVKEAIATGLALYAWYRKGKVAS